MLAIYTRISVDRNNQVSIDTQFEQGKKLATKLNIGYKQYIDKSVSGTSDLDKRPSLFELIKDIENNIITKVYVYDQSRLERQPEVRFALIKIFDKYNIELYYESGLVSNDTETELIGNLMSVVNNYFVKLTQKKIKLALNHNAEVGKVHALPPYAYYKDSNNKYAINNEQAEIIKEIYALSLSGVGTNRIAEILNERGVPTKYNLIGKGTLSTTNNKHKLKPLVTKNKTDIKWSGNTVRGVLYNKFYAGIRVFNGVEYEVPKIVDYEYWKKVNSNLVNNRNNSGKVVTHKYLLKGVLTCSKCGRNYYGRSRVSLKDNAYICSSKRYKNLNCGNRGINIPVLENLVWFYIENNEIEYVINYIQDNSTDSIISEKELIKNELNKELKVLKKQYNNLISLVENGVLKALEIKDKVKANKDLENDINIKIANIDKELSILNNTLTNEFSMPTEVDFNSKKEIINKLINNIEILFDENLYYIRIYPVLNNVRYNLAYMEYVIDYNFKYKVTNVFYSDNYFKNVRYYNSILSNLKSLKELV
jgi:site-specific DNA recombinase